MRIKAAWIENIRPGIRFEISQLAQAWQERFEEGRKVHLKRLNAVVRYNHDNMVNHQFPKLKLRSLLIIGYSDAFANNHDLTSKLGQIVMLIDGKNNGAPISFKRFKSKNVTRLVLSAGIVAFADLFDDFFALASQMEHALGPLVPMHLLADSKS